MCYLPPMTLYTYLPNERCEVRSKKFFLADIKLKQMSYSFFYLYIYIGNFNKLASVGLTVLQE